MLVLMLVAGSGALAPSAAAQSSWDTAPADDRTQYEAPRTPDPAGTGVPDWADSGSSSNGFRSGSEGSIGFGPEMNQGAPGPPNDGGPNPNPVPVDGGLSLLVLAGAGYAANKLREGNDDESERDSVV